MKSRMTLTTVCAQVSPAKETSSWRFWILGLLMLAWQGATWAGQAPLVSHSEITYEGGDGQIHVMASLNRPSVKNGEQLVISALVKSSRPIAAVEAELGGVDNIQLQPKPTAGNGPLAGGGYAGLYEAVWTAYGLEERVYDVTLKVRDVSGHTYVNRSLKFSDPAAGISTPGSVNYLNGGMQRVAGIELAAGENLVGCGVIDTVNGYAYLGTYTDPAWIVKIALGDGNNPPYRVGAVQLEPGERWPNCAVIDVAKGYAYFGLVTSPGRIVKIKLGDGDAPPTRVSALVLPTLERYLRSAVIDTANGYAYFGTDTNPGRVIKVRLEDGDTTPTRIGRLDLIANQEEMLYCAVIDPDNGYAYFGTYTSPGRVVKVNLGSGASLPTRVGAVVLDPGEDNLASAVIDPAQGYAYFGTFTSPGRVVRVALGAGSNPPSRVDAMTLPTGEDFLTRSDIDLAAGFAYFGTYSNPAYLVKVALGTSSIPPSRNGALQLPLNEDWVSQALMDPNSGYVYFANGGSPARFVKVTTSQKRFIKSTAFTMLEPGLVNEVRVYSHAASGNARLALYDDSSPQQLIWQSDLVPVNVAEGWLAVPISAGTPSEVTLLPGIYHLAWQVDSTQHVMSFFDEGALGEGRSVVYDFDAFPGTLDETSVTLTTERWSGYITYNECAYELSPTSQEVDAAGASGLTVDVLTSGSCPWTAASSEPWLVITSGDSGSGSGTITYSVAANPGTTRTATITVGDQIHTILQANGCSYSISPETVEIPASGANGVSIEVTASDASCVWTAVASEPWVTITSGNSGSGNGTVTYDVDANPGTTRTATITLAGLTHTITQASGCIYSITPVSVAGISTPGSRNYLDGGMLRLAGIDLEAGQDIVGCGVIDTVNGYAYFGTYTDPAWIVKVALGDGDNPPYVVGAVQLEPGERWPNCAVIDVANGYAYFGLVTNPGRIVKIKLGDGDAPPTRVSALVLPSLERYLRSAVIDTANGYAYFGTDTNPGRVIKVRLEDGDTTPTRIGSIDLVVNQERELYCAVIDPNNGYAYFGTFTSPGRVVKVSLGSGSSLPTRVGAVVLDPGEDSLGSAVIDTTQGYAYFGTFTSPGRVVRVALGAGSNPPTRVDAVTLDPGEDFLTRSDIDLNAGFAYFGTFATPGFLVKVALGTATTPPSRTGSLELPAGEDSVTQCLVDPGNDYVYLSNASSPARLVKVKTSQRGFIKSTALSVAEAGQVKSVRVYCHAASGNVRLALYDDSSPQQLLWESGVVPVDVAEGWLDVPISSGTPLDLTLLPGTYHLAWQVDSTQHVMSFYDEGPLGSGRSVVYDFGPFPGTIEETSVTQTTERWSGYITTYEPEPVVIPAGGANGLVVDVTASHGSCPWTAAPSHPWVTITSADSGAGNGLVTYDVAANPGTTRTATITIAGLTHTIIQESGCVYAITPTNVNVSAVGTTGLTIEVAANDASCPWTAVASEPWVTITSGDSGTGNGTVTYNVAANPGPTRTATITVGDQVHTITQADGCSYSISPTSRTVGAGGGFDLTVDVTTSDPSCEWTVESSAPWLLAFPTSGTGSGTVSYAVLPNLGPTRTATLTIEGQVHTVIQESGCAYSISPSSVDVGAAGASGLTIEVTTTDPSCPWTAVASEPWVTITSGASGTGNGMVTYDVDANPGTTRTATITIADQTHTITQASGCVYSIAPASVDVPAAGASGLTIEVTASDASCPWTAVASEPWVTITSGVSGTGNGTVTYDVAANPGTTRTATIIVAGEVHTITQEDGCVISVSPETVEIAAGGANGVSIEVTASDVTCAWAAVASEPWVTITSGDSGNGSGTITYDVAANPGTTRTATIIVDGQIHTIIQESGCAYLISPPSVLVPAGGDDAMIGVTASDASCPWTAVASEPWVTITSGASGTGNGTVTYDVDANAGTTRTATITIADQTHTITQASGCVYSITPASVYVLAAGASGLTIDVTASDASCPWTAVASEPWITITSGAAGSGYGVVTYDVTPNVGPERTGTILVGGKIHKVIQMNGCSVTSVSPRRFEVPAEGAEGLTFEVTATEASCAWEAQPDHLWVTITSGSPGTGDGTVTFSVLPNTGCQRETTILVEGQSVRVVQAAAFAPLIAENFAIPTSEKDWSPLGMSMPGLADQVYDTTNSALLARVYANPNRFRAAGYVSDSSLWLPYEAVGSDLYVRGKFYVFASPHAVDWQTTGAMPHVRMRLSHRFAQNAMLEVFNHLNVDPASVPLGQEIRPSTDPARPSLYRVDFDPVDTPFLRDNGTTEGIWAAFEAYTMEPQDEGYVGLAEIVMGVYPKALLPDSAAPVKVFEPSDVDAGTLAVVSPTDLTKVLYDISGPLGPGEIPPLDTNPSTPQPTYTEGAGGITLSSVGVPANRLAIIAREFDPGAFTERVRIEANKVYKIRFHVTSTQFSNRQCQMRARARAVRWLWSQKLEIGGAYCAGSAANADAQQALPGIGCQNPDREPSDTAGGWYTLIIHSPLREEIRAEYDPGDPIEVRMPLLSAQPGPGVAAPSFRDLRVGFDLLDTLSGSLLRDLEEGEFTLDRIEIRVYDDIGDTPCF